MWLMSVIEEFHVGFTCYFISDKLKQSLIWTSSRVSGSQMQKYLFSSRRELLPFYIWLVINVSSSYSFKNCDPNKFKEKVPKAHVHYLINNCIASKQQK